MNDISLRPFDSRAAQPVTTNNVAAPIQAKPLLPTGQLTPTYRKLIYAFIALGIFLRLFHFFDNRSFWIDEVYLSSSLLRMNFMELATLPLDYQQKAPIGFLWAVKLCVIVFGKSEMALRLFPLLCGIASLFVVVPFTRYFLSPLGVVVAVGIFSFAPPLVYHSVEIKQYGAEALATILIMLSYIRYHKRVALQPLLVWGVLGAVISWFSFASIFVLMGIAATLSLQYIIKRDWRALFLSFIPFAMWVASFGASYMLLTHKYVDSEWLTIWFSAQRAFMPVPPSSVSDIMWFFSAPFKIFNYPLGLNWFYLELKYGTAVRYFVAMGIVPLVLSCFGVYHYYHKSRKELMLLTIPLLLALLASGVKAYPFYERLLVFLAPLLILLVAAGCSKATAMFKQSNRWRYILPLLVLVGPVANSAHQVVRPDHFAGESFWGVGKKQYYQEAMQHIREHFQPGDGMYVYWNFRHAYEVYDAMYDMKLGAVKGSDVRYAVTSEREYFQKLAPEVQSLAGRKRVWVIYNVAYNTNIIGEIEGEPKWYVNSFYKVAPDMLIRRQFAAAGKELSNYRLGDIRIALFDLSQ